jgi:hypothetical protein
MSIPVLHRVRAASNGYTGISGSQRPAKKQSGGILTTCLEPKGLLFFPPSAHALPFHSNANLQMQLEGSRSGVSGAVTAIAIHIFFYFDTDPVNMIMDAMMSIGLEPVIATINT